MGRSALVTVFRDARGRVDARAAIEDDARAGHLAAMLTGGLQSDLESVEKALGDLALVERGEVDEAFIGGNVYEMTVKADGAELELNIFPDDPPSRFSISEVRAAVADWHGLLKET
jgi:hypothetical protein